MYICIHSDHVLHIDETIILSHLSRTLEQLRQPARALNIQIFDLTVIHSSTVRLLVCVLVAAASVCGRPTACQYPPTTPPWTDTRSYCESAQSVRACVVLDTDESTHMSHHLLMDIAAVTLCPANLTTANWPDRQLTDLPTNGMPVLLVVVQVQSALSQPSALRSFREPHLGAIRQRIQHPRFSPCGALYMNLHNLPS